MFGLGFWEIIIICIAIIIFIRPEDIPKFAKKAGKLYGDIKRYYHDFFYQFKKIEQEIKNTALPVLPEKENSLSKKTSKVED